MMIDPRIARLGEAHFAPLMDLVKGLRARGLAVPNVDPEDGGAYAKVLCCAYSRVPDQRRSARLSCLGIIRIRPLGTWAPCSIGLA